MVRHAHIRSLPAGKHAARPSPATHERAGARSALAQPPEGAHAFFETARQEA
jgi:hypothetical protein